MNPDISRQAVGVFFEQYPWLGRLPRPFLPESPVQLWLGSRLENFFSQLPWGGQAAVVPSLSSTSSLTAAVGDFFGAIAWEGKPVIAPVPPIPWEPEPYHRLKLTDLADLF